MTAYTDGHVLAPHAVRTAAAAAQAICCSQAQYRAIHFALLWLAQAELRPILVSTSYLATHA